MHINLINFKKQDLIVQILFCNFLCFTQQSILDIHKFSHCQSMELKVLKGGKPECSVELGLVETDEFQYM